MYTPLFTMHTPLASGNTHFSVHPWNSGQIQWARGGVGPPPRAPTVSDERKKISAPLLLYDDCLVTQHPEV